MADALEKVKKYVLKICEIISIFSPIALLLQNVPYVPGLKVLSCQKKLNE